MKTLGLSEIYQRYLVYLAGPISGLNYEEATGWRNYVKEKLPHTIGTMSPMRHKQFLKKEEMIAGSYDNTPLSTQRGIFHRDSWDCSRADAIFVNLLGAETVSIGTVMEIAWGALNKNPIILAMEETGNLHDHAMVREACPYIVRSLDEGIETLKALFVLDE